MERQQWTCPKCGPVFDPPFGEDERFHCSGLRCDRVVSLLSTEERRGLGPAPKPRPTKTKTACDRAEIERGRKILARVNRRAREIKARREGKTVARKKTKKKTAAKKTKKKRGPSDAARAKAAEGRDGTCSKCGGEKWLLRKDPPTCTACVKAEGPKKRRRRA